MGNAIQLNFDKRTTNKIKKLWTSLKYHSICDFMIVNDVEPHITLFVFDQPMGDDERKIMKIVSDYFEKVNSFEIDIYSIGVLPNDENIVYLSLMMTNELMQVHSELYEMLKKEGFHHAIIEKCKPNHWKPYITMTRNINDTNMIDAIKLLKRKFKPVTARLVSSSYIEFFPVNYKATIKLSE